VEGNNAIVDGNETCGREVAKARQHSRYNEILKREKMGDPM